MNVFFRQRQHGLMWPEYWLKHCADENSRSLLESKPDILLKLKSILCFDVLNNLLILLTFGLTSPLLAIVIACVVVLKMCSWILLLGRFCSFFSGSNTNTEDFTVQSIASAEKGESQATTNTTTIVATSQQHTALKALATRYIPLDEVLKQSFWQICWCSALFFALICWDIAADEVGWFESIWLPIVSCSYPGILWLIYRVMAYQQIVHVFKDSHEPRVDQMVEENISLSESTIELSINIALTTNPIHQL
jgi:hypothetical protein